MTSGRRVITVSPRLSFVWAHLFARWLVQQRAFALAVAGLNEAIGAHQCTYPGDDFVLLPHREAILRCRFQSLALTPLLEIERLSDFDVQEHPLETLATAITRPR